MTRLHYNPERIEEGIKAIAEADESFRLMLSKMAGHIGAALDRHVQPCSTCHRLMVPRKMWYTMKPEERPYWLIANGTGSQCTAHQQKGQRRMPAETVRRLRSLVNVDLSRDYDTEEEASA